MPAGMWEIIPYIGTPLALIAFIASVIGWNYWSSQSNKYKALEGVTDPAIRLKMLQEYLGRYAPEVDNLRIEDKVQQLNQQAQHSLTRFKWLVIATAGLLALVLVVVVILAVVPRPPQETGRQDQPKQAVELGAGSDQPLAKLDNFAGTALVHNGGTQYISGTTFVVMNGNAKEDNMAYPVAAFELAKVARHDVIKVNSVRATWELPKKRIEPIFQTVLANFEPPLTYSVRLSPKSQSKAADIKINGGITDGLITFTDESPVRKCRIEFEGEPGLYSVNVEVEVQEARGSRKQLLKSEQPVYIALAEKMP